MLLLLEGERHIIRYRRKSQTKARASSQIALDFNCAAELGYDLIDDHQPQSRALSSIFRRVERIEDVTHDLWSHAGSGVSEIDDDALCFAVPAFERRANANLATFRNAAERVFHEVPR